MGGYTLPMLTQIIAPMCSGGTSLLRMMAQLADHHLFEPLRLDDATYLARLKSTSKSPEKTVFKDTACQLHFMEASVLPNWLQYMDAMIFMQRDPVCEYLSLLDKIITHDTNTNANTTAAAQQFFSVNSVAASMATVNRLYLVALPVAAHSGLKVHKLTYDDLCADPAGTITPLVADWGKIHPSKIKAVVNTWRKPLQLPESSQPIPMHFIEQVKSATGFHPDALQREQAKKASLMDTNPSQDIIEQLQGLSAQYQTFRERTVADDLAIVRDDLQNMAAAQHAATMLKGY